MVETMARCCALSPLALRKKARWIASTSVLFPLSFGPPISVRAPSNSTVRSRWTRYCRSVTEWRRMGPSVPKTGRVQLAQRDAGDRGGLIRAAGAGHQLGRDARDQRVG